MSTSKIFCHHCKKEIPILGIVGRRDECPFCRNDLHVCKNCQHYDEKSYNECREPQAERVLEKEKSNFCDFFLPGSSTGSISDAKAKQLALAEALFKKK